MDYKIRNYINIKTKQLNQIYGRKTNDAKRKISNNTNKV